MTFKWKIIRPSFQGVAANIEVMHPGIEVEFETGSIGEAHGIFSDNGTALSEMFGGSIMANASALASDIDGAQGETKPEAPVTRRGRGPNKPKNIEAVAPEPVAIPGVEAPLAPVDAAPLNTAPGANGIPAFLDRTATVAAPPAPPPPPPAAPPTGVLAGKIVSKIEEKVNAANAAGDMTAGQAFADWLATSGITVKGATYSEAVTVLRLQADEKLGPIAQALGVAA